MSPSTAQIIVVTTTAVGPAGPLKRHYAVAVEDRELALREVGKKLKPSETARWLDARRLSLAPGEVRQI